MTTSPVHHKESVPTAVLAVMTSKFRATTKPASLTLWHNRMGHPGIEPLAHTRQSADVIMTDNDAIQKHVSDGDEIYCQACVETKLTTKIS